MTQFIVLLAIALAVVAALILTRGSRRAPIAPRAQVRPTLLRHPIRPVLPAAIQAVIQDGVLEAAFQQALVPQFLYPLAAEVDPVAGQSGQRFTKTRTGLLTPKTAPITGSDPSPSTYSIEQYSGVLDQYGDSIDTNMAGSAVAQSRLFTRNVQTLAIGAGQSLNRIARDRLYAVYAGGRTWVRTTDGASNTTVDVQSVDGFETVIVNGVPTPVSASTPLAITINGVANTVTGVDRANRRLTLGTGTTDTAGHAVVAANAPVSIRPNARATARDIVGGDIATLSLFDDAVARLRTMNVPTMPDGTYHAHVDAVTNRQLLDDTRFRQMFQGLGESTAQTRQGLIGTVGNVTFYLNIEAPTVTGDGQSLTVRRPIVLGDEPLVNMPLEGQGRLLEGTGVEDIPGISLEQAIPGVEGTEVVFIVRPPQDRLQQVVSASWSWIGDFCVPTDSTTGDAAIAKRAVVIEHA